MNNQLVQQEAITGKSTRFKVNGRDSGAYLVKVDVDGGNSRTKKVYIE